MRILALGVALLFSQIAVTGEPLAWSKYTSSLKLQSIDEHNNFAVFRGHVTISGELVFVFEASGRQAGLLWVILIPDPGEADKLPQVMAGTFPGRLHDLWVLPPDTVLAQFPGVQREARGGSGNSRIVRRHATLVLTAYTTGAECSDTRGYHATLVRVLSKGPQSEMAVNVENLNGC